MAKATRKLLGSFNPARGRHAPGHLREAFEDWVEGGMKAKTIKVGYEEIPMPPTWLFGVLWNCSDIKPDYLCEYLDLLPGSTYAQAVRQLKRELAE